MNRYVAVIGCLAALATVACGGQKGNEQKTGSITAGEVRAQRANLPPELVAALDSGNAAFRAGDYEAALQQYRKAVELRKDVAAGWFGVYMAQRALGNIAAADSALSVAQKLAPGATLIHPERSPEP